jgi:hypothetical protein
MTATNTTAGQAPLRYGMIVLYRGSVQSRRGQLFRITGTSRTRDGGARYDLAPYLGERGARAELRGSRRESVTRVLPAQIKTRTCRDKDCGATYLSVPEHGINPDGCPLCALPEPAF